MDVRIIANGATIPIVLSIMVELNVLLNIVTGVERQLLRDLDVAEAVAPFTFVECKLVAIFGVLFPLDSVLGVKDLKGRKRIQTQKSKLN